MASDRFEITLCTAYGINVDIKWIQYNHLTCNGCIMESLGENSPFTKMKPGAMDVVTEQQQQQSRVRNVIAKSCFINKQFLR